LRGCDAGRAGGRRVGSSVGVAESEPVFGVSASDSGSKFACILNDWAGSGCGFNSEEFTAERSAS